MKVDLFDFDLPPERIALRPAVPRDAARLLIVPASGPFLDKAISDLPGLLKAGDVLVVNDTRVIPARLLGKRGEARIEITLHKRNDALEWCAFAKGAKKIRTGDRLEFQGIAADVLTKGEGGEITLRFLCRPEEMLPALDRAGAMPLPPYIASKRETDIRDRADYQTVFAAREGAVAAPTAGLHFTENLIKNLRHIGIQFESVTLHVGAGTFLPMKAADTDDHRMHAEWGEITPDAAARLNTARKEGRRIIAVGTTSLRLLETAVDSGGRFNSFASETSIFITPGYHFRGADALITNFHLPKSTLFMLVSALMGLSRMKTAYEHAIRTGYRFYSYGDACLLLPEKGL